MKPRPQTPLVSLINSSMSNLENENEKQSKNEYYLKNFSNCMKQVILLFEKFFKFYETSY